MTRLTRNGMRAALAAAVLSGSEPLSFAAEHGHEDSSSSEAWLSLGFSTVNFLIFLFLMYRYAWPALRDFLASRHKEVADAMAAAEQARREADAIRSEYAAKEAALEETRRRMLEEIRQGAVADREKSLRDAEAAAARLRTEAERQAEHDLARARRELRAEAARLAAELAEKEVEARLTDADRARLVKEFVEGVAKQ
ncbi:MAG TPA: F0F1 ATP synthase subunit B [Candidatus Limnocylindrales bacterium]|nr:F0F1 ATP synthase subunit B [Candidatus Limnocylindrales bacterium]